MKYLQGDNDINTKLQLGPCYLKFSKICVIAFDAMETNLNTLGFKEVVLIPYFIGRNLRL